MPVFVSICYFFSWHNWAATGDLKYLWKTLCPHSRRLHPMNLWLIFQLPLCSLKSLEILYVSAWDAPIHGPFHLQTAGFLWVPRYGPNTLRCFLWGVLDEINTSGLWVKHTSSISLVGPQSTAPKGLKRTGTLTPWRRGNFSCRQP